MMHCISPLLSGEIVLTVGAISGSCDPEEIGGVQQRLIFDMMD